MTHQPRRVRQRVLLIALTACMAFGGGGAAAQSVSPTPVSPTADDASPLLRAFDDLYDPMEADRQLLIELRKPLPEERPDAEAYLARIQRLATISDPARLGQPASRVMETLPVYLDWRDETFASPSEAQEAFLTSGAAGFDTNFDELKNAILLTVANRLDALLTIRDRIR